MDNDDRDAATRYYADKFFLESLESDVSRCESLLAASPHDAFARRTLVRTTFAEVEGLSNYVLGVARERCGTDEAPGTGYSDAERVVLRERSVNIPAKTTFRLALSFMCRGVASAPAIDLRSDGGWSSLIEALKVRDRLMHPKIASHLEVSDQELAQVRRGRTWFVATYKALEAAEQEAGRVEFSRLFSETS